ncbi:MAG: hypothetical protein HUJ75_03450 [Parasporobacterium sp.]|nr:hypothetical protein [Parasporobacterium sp.]
MKKTVNGYIKSISARNLIFPVIVLAILAGLVLLVPFRNVIFPDRASGIKELAELFKAGQRYAEVDVDELHYTGYDYYNGSRVSASYYFILEDDEDDVRCAFFLLPSDGNAEETLNNRTIKVRMIANDKQFNAFISEYAEDIGWSSEGLLDICGGFIASAYDYRPILYYIAAGLIAFLAVLSITGFFVNLAVFFVPSLHSSARRLRHFGLDREDFKAIDHELAHDVMLKAGQLFITDHYLVAIGQYTLYVVPLYNIVWAYSYSSWSEKRQKGKLTYSLIIVTSPKDKITMPGFSKARVDKVLDFLERDFSHIVVGYSDEIKEEMDRLN